MKSSQLSPFSQLTSPKCYNYIGRFFGCVHSLLNIKTDTQTEHMIARRKPELLKESVNSDDKKMHLKFQLQMNFTMIKVLHCYVFV